MSTLHKFLILTVSGWVKRNQQEVIDYLREENRNLRERVGLAPVALYDCPTAPTCLSE